MATKTVQEGIPWIEDDSKENDYGLTIQVLGPTAYSRARVWIDIFDDFGAASRGENSIRTIGIDKDTFIDALQEAGLI